MKTLKKFEFKQVAQSKYPWDKILDGGIYELSEGTDFDCSTRNMTGKVRSAARKKYKTVKLSASETAKTITLQATDMDAEQRASEDARRAGVKARKAERNAEDDDVVLPA
jgi:hypothetical protein